MLVKKILLKSALIISLSAISNIALAEQGTIDTLKEAGKITTGESAYTLTQTNKVINTTIPGAEYNEETKEVKYSNYELNLKKLNYGTGNTTETINLKRDSASMFVPSDITVNYNTDVANKYENITKTSEIDASGVALETFTKNLGSVIQNDYDKQIDINDAIFINNALNVDYIGVQNTIRLYSGTVYNNGTITNVIADFIGNHTELNMPNYTISSYRPTAFIYGSTLTNHAISRDSIITNINGNFINNYVINKYPSTNGTVVFGNALTNISLDLHTAIIENITGDFVGNYIQASGSACGGAISNLTNDAIFSGTSKEGSVAKIGNITGDFVGNHIISNRTSLGGAISNTSIIDNITGNFIGNYVNNGIGGAISNIGSITNIIGDFIGNYAAKGGNGGAIFNSGNINNIIGDFINNYSNQSSTDQYATGGAIYNSSTIGNITGNFINNHISGNAIGGAIYNRGTISSITNSNFLNNYAIDTSTNASILNGGAIYSTNNLHIIADNGSSIFSGNYIQRGKDTDSNYYIDNEAIYTPNLNLESKNNGHIVFDDKITASTTNIYGDNTSDVHLNNQISGKTILNDTNLYIGTDTFKTSSLSAESGNVQLADGKVQNYNINNLTSSQDANYTIDIDTTGSTVQSDKLYTGSTSSGTVTIDDINFNGPEKDFKAQVLVNQNDYIQLDLSDELSSKYNKTEVEKILTSDEMKSNVNWQDKFNSYEQDKTTTSSLNLATTKTANDSIEYSSSTTLGEVVSVGAGDTLGLLNQYETNEIRNFNFDTSSDEYLVTTDLGTTSTGTININGVLAPVPTENSERSTINGNNHSLFKLDNATTLNLNNVKVTNANNVATGTNKDAVININNSVISNNTEGIKTSGSVNILGNSVIENNGKGIEVTSDTSVITLDGSDSEITLRDRLTGVAGAKLNIQKGTVNLEKKISVLDIMMEQANVNVASDNLLEENNLTVNSASNLNMINNTVGMMYLNNLTLNDNLNLGVDVDLANKSMDRITAANYNLGDKLVNVSQMNLLTSTDRDITRILFADEGLRNNVTTSISEVAYSPIWKYGVTYNKNDGNFVFTRGGETPNNPNTFNSYNPAVMVSPVAAQLGGYIGMIDTYNNAFNHMDMRMLMPSSLRIAQKQANKYAITETSGTTYAANETNHGGTWARPFAAYDSVGLKNGPKVNNFSYGTFIGGDTGIHEFKNGYDGVLSVHVSYLGSHQSFNGNSIYQNGGNLGLTGTLYKGNFFTGLSINSGAGIADASTMYGNENFPMFMAGIANKTGYNIEFKEGKFIIQPSLLLSYTFVNTFNYTNASGIKIDADPLHAMQISPNVRFAFNTQNGWQPYLTAGMNWNIMNSSEFMANAAELPSLSVKPYVQYGFGLQKTVNDNFTAYAQVLLRNGGQNGIAANAGMKYLFGHESRLKESI